MTMIIPVPCFPDAIFSSVHTDEKSDDEDDEEENEHCYHDDSNRPISQCYRR